MTLRTLGTAAAFLLVAGNGTAFAADGAAIYKTQCAKCHGDTGHADSPAAKAMKAPALAGDAKIAGMSDAELVTKIKENKKHVTLKSVSDADLTAVAAHVKQLAGAK
jgi:mono/diheme cytochrome c family protein